MSIRVSMEDQHLSLVMACRPEPHVLLLDDKAAEAYWHEVNGYFNEPICRIPLTGDRLLTSGGMLLVVRVPDTQGKPLVLDQWGKAAS